MVTVENFKGYMRIPYDDDDEIIAEMLTVAYGYLKSAVDDFDIIYSENEEFSSKADMFAKFYAGELYDNREQLQGDKNPSYMCRSLMTQLQLYQKQEVKTDA